MEDSITQDLQAIREEINEFKKAKQLAEEKRKGEEYRESFAEFRICFNSFVKVAVGVAGLKYNVSYNDLKKGLYYFRNEPRKGKDCLEKDNALFLIPSSQAPKDKEWRENFDAIYSYLTYLGLKMNDCSHVSLGFINNPHHKTEDYSFRQYYQYKKKYMDVVYDDFDVLYKYLIDNYPEQMLCDNELIDSLNNCVESTQKEVNVIDGSIENVLKCYRRFLKGISANNDNNELDEILKKWRKVAKANQKQVKSCKSKIEEKSKSYKEFTIDVIGPMASGKSTLMDLLSREIIRGNDADRTVNVKENINEIIYKNLRLREIAADKDGCSYSSVDGYADFVICVFNVEAVGSKKDVLKVCEFLKSLNKPYQCVFNVKRCSDEKYMKYKDSLKVDFESVLGCRDEVVLFDFKSLKENKGTSNDIENCDNLLDILKKIITTTSLSFRRLCLYDLVENIVFYQYDELRKEFDSFVEKKDDLMKVFNDYQNDLEKIQHRHRNKIQKRESESFSPISSLFHSGEDDLKDEIKKDYSDLSDKYTNIFKLKTDELNKGLTSIVSISKKVIDNGPFVRGMGALALSVFKLIPNPIIKIAVPLAIALGVLTVGLTKTYDKQAKKVNCELENKKKKTEELLNQLMKSIQNLSDVCLESHKIVVRSLLCNYFEELGYGKEDIQKIVKDVARVPGKVVIISTENKEEFFPEMMIKMQQAFGQEKIVIYTVGEKRPKGETLELAFKQFQ